MEVAEFVVAVGRALAREGVELAREMARVGVREREAAMRDEAILGVVRGRERRDAGLADPHEVAVGIVEQLAAGLAVHIHGCGLTRSAAKCDASKDQGPPRSMHLSSQLAPTRICSSLHEPRGATLRRLSTLFFPSFCESRNNIF